MSSAEIVKRFRWKGRVGCTFPAVVQHGVTHSPPMLIRVGCASAEPFLRQKTGCLLRLVNDADPVGLAEGYFGAAKGVPGVVMVLTFGTGIGSALLMNGRLVPNLELGHLEIRGKDAEKRASDLLRAQKDLSWGKWAEAGE